jgi:hypothetical protein
MSIPTRLHLLASLLCAGTLLSACENASKRDTNDGADMDAWGCVVVDRSLVEDPSAPAEGFDFAAADALALWSGDWSGSLVPTLEDGSVGEAVDATLSLGSDGSFEAVLSEPGDSAMEYAFEDGIDCAPRYETTVSTALIAGATGAEIHESFEAPLTLWASRASLWTDIALDDVEGSLEPAMDPAEFDSVWMTVSLFGEDALLTGDLGWMAEKIEGEGDDGTAMAMMAPIGELSLERP